MAAVAVAALIAAYLVGYWPERQRRVALDRDVGTLREDVAELQGRLRAAQLLGELLHVSDAAAAMNYGRAQDLSSTFFNQARDEVTHGRDGGMRAELQAIAQQRDTVTAMLARGDPRVVEMLRQLEVQLRQALGYPVSREALAPRPVITDTPP